MENEFFLNLIKVITLGVLSFSFSFLLVPLYLRIALKFKIIDKPKRIDAPIASETLKEKEGTPTMGGVIIWLPPLFLALFFFIFKNFFGDFFEYLNFTDRRETYLPLAGLFLGGFFGLIDDLIHWWGIGPYRGLSRKQTFLIYLSIALIFAWWFITKLNYKFIDLADHRFYVGSLIFLFYFLLVFLSTTLSTDIVDGMDGLFAGVSLIILSCLTFFAFLNGDYHLASFGGVLIGSLLAYLWFNFYPAKFFDGNNGSMAVGTAIALMSFLTQSTLVLPLIAIVLVIESGSVILQVFSKKVFKKKIFPSTPIHHTFKAMGLNEANIVVRFWIVNLIGAIFGVVIYLIFKIL